MTAQFQVNVSTFVAIMRQVLTQPRSFFQNMPKTGGYGDPLLYFAVIGLLDGLILWLLNLFGLNSGVVPASTSLFGAFMMVVMAPLGGVVAAFFAYLLWRLLGSRLGYETAFRCLAFISSIGPVVMLLRVVPYLGTTVNVLWGGWLLYIASVEVHALAQSRVKSAIAVLVLVLLLMGLQGERNGRRMQARIAGFGGQLQGLEGKTPEQMGQAMGEFLKGLENGVKP